MYGTVTCHSEYMVRKKICRAGSLFAAGVLAANIGNMYQQQALAEGHGIIPAMLFLRHKVDALEAITDDNVWPLPKYREMLFIC